MTARRYGNGVPRKTPKKSAPRTRKKASDARRVRAIIDELKRLYPDADCELDRANPFQLLVATILSAQSTDKTVNVVTPKLFARFSDAAALAGAEQSEVEKLVHSTGFFRNKAKNIIGAARVLAREFDGVVPRTMEEMLTLPGVARKTANVVLGTAYGIASGFVVDTHVTRLSQRLGLSREEDPVKIERDLTALVPQKLWIEMAHQLIWHGRRVCDAKKPKCHACTLAPHCPSALEA